MMKNIFPVVLIILLNSCNSIENDGKKVQPKEGNQMEVLINGIGWTDYYENDKQIEYRPSGIIQNGINWGNERESSLSIGWRIDYESHYWENLSVRFVFPADYEYKDMEGFEILFNNNDHPLAGLNFSEWDYDVSVSEYNRYDSTEVTKAKITYFNYEEKIVEVEFEGKLILADYIMERPDHSEWNKRPDTLHITNGRIRTIFQDLRPEQ